jgi:hypothetical protein
MCPPGNETPNGRSGAAANVEFAGKDMMNQDANPGLRQRGAGSTGAHSPKLMQLRTAGLLDEARQYGGIGTMAAGQNTCGRLYAAGNGQGLSYGN